MRGRSTSVELEVFAEHADQVFFQAHHQRVHPSVEQHIRAFKTHLRRVAGREVLHVHRGGNHRAGNALALGDVALHLRAQNQLGLQRVDLGFDFQVVVGDQGFDAVAFATVAHLAGKFAAVSAQAHHLKTHLLAGDAGGGHHVGGVAKNIDPLAGQVGRIDRLGVPVGVGVARVLCGLGQAGERADFGDEVACGVAAQGHGLGVRLVKLTLQPLRGGQADFGVEHHVEVGLGQFLHIGDARAQGRDHSDIDTQLVQQLRDFLDVVAVAKAQGAGAQDVAGGSDLRGLIGGGFVHQVAAQLVKGLARAPVFLALVRGQLQGHHGDGQLQGLGQTARVVLDQLGGAGRAHQHGSGVEARHGLACSVLEQLGRVTAQIARLEGGVGDGRAARQALDHGEQQVGVSVALRGVQHIVHVRHGGGHAHRAHMGRSFVSPERQLHGVFLRFQAASFRRRLSGRLNSPAKSAACS